MAGVVQKVFVNALDGLQVGDLVTKNTQAKVSPYLPMLMPTVNVSATSLMNEVLSDRLQSRRYSYNHPYHLRKSVDNTNFIIVEMEQTVCLNNQIDALDNAIHELLEDLDLGEDNNNEHFHRLNKWSTLVVMHCMGHEGPFVTYVSLDTLGGYRKLTQVLKKVA